MAQARAKLGVRTRVRNKPPSETENLLLGLGKRLPRGDAAWHMAGGGPPVTTKWVTVNRINLITFENPNR